MARLLSFREFVRSGRGARVKRPVIVYFRGQAGARFAEHNFDEASRQYEFKQGWWARVDRTHHDPTKKHIHVYHDEKQIVVVNQDGTPSHSSDVDAAPNWIYKELRKKGELDESRFITDDQVLVPHEIIQSALDQAERFAPLRRVLRLLCKR